MAKYSNILEAERSRKLNEYLQGLKDLFQEDLKSVVYLCYELGATQDQIADALGKARNTVATQYPKKKEITK